ncbi:hypothetical protein [Streptomyces sp. GQFP]|uniref:hypothetical protein n=1 Tax=Streptomyces sp. GQFP TaxID=2907545 RepID=UPI001F250756|nr:hypothetical protein [Streptomyces sp. GQFP]UIX32425.1 hypothetical protein LUX31_21615 [Streptomyces sp. GQFP]
MQNVTGKALLVGAATALAITIATPAQAASVIDKGDTACARKNSAGRCTYGIGVIWQYKKGSNTRTVTFVSAEIRPAKTGASARWLYKKPGGKTHVGKSWRKAVKGSNSTGSWSETTWGTMQSTTGPKFPKNTQICIQWKGYEKKACLKVT